jgi:hypothetical protein
VADLVDSHRVRVWSFCPPEEHDTGDERDRQRERNRQPSRHSLNLNRVR